MSERPEKSRAAEPGIPEAEDELLPELYEELRRLALRAMASERESHTLQATALVHEAWLRLGEGEISPRERARFYCAAATAMRRILINHARDKARLKRGGGARQVALDISEVTSDPRCELDFALLDEALERLASEDPRKARLVELRYFAGLDNETTAEALGISVATLKREWTAAKAWLSLYMERSDERG